MEGQQDKRQDEYSDESSGWYSDSSDGSYPDEDLYSDVYSKEEETPTSKGPELTDNMNDEVSENNSQEASNMAALTVTLPLVTAICVLLLVVSLILLWKKTVKRESSKRVSKSTANNEITQVEGTKYPRENHSIQLPLSSLGHRVSGGNGNVEEGAIANGNTYAEEAEYLELDEDVPEMYQKTIFKMEGYQPGSEYMDLGSNSAKASVYEQLNQQRRRFEIDNISPNNNKEVTTS